MTPHQVLDLARDGELEKLGADREAVAGAVRSFAAVDDAASALELAGRAWRIWFSRGELDEGGAVVAAALGTPGARDIPVWYVRALYADGLLAFRAGDERRSLERNEEALHVARETDDVQGECDALTGLARVALRDGRFDDVVVLAGDARARARSAGDRAAEASPLHLQAAGVRLKGDYAAARTLYLESLDLNATLGADGFVTTEQHNLGWVELHLGSVDEAAERFRLRDAGSGADAYGEAWSDLNWAAIAAARGEREDAKRRFAAGKGKLDELGVVLDPDDRTELEWLTARLADD